MSTTPKGRRIPAHSAVIWSRMKLRWPFLVWLAAVVAGLYLYHHSSQSYTLSGVMDIERYKIAPLETARLLSLTVKPGQAVMKGDILARMDPSLLDSELELERLQLHRQFMASTQQIESDLRDETRRQAENAGELEVLTDELERLEDLLLKQLVDAQVVVRTRARQRALAQSAPLISKNIESLEAERTRATEQMQKLDQWLNGQSTASLDLEAKDSQGRLISERIGALENRRNNFVLRAIKDGYVSEVSRSTGEVIAAGEEILTIVARGPQQVIGFVPEDQAHLFSLGLQALIMKPLSGRIAVPAIVTGLTPEMMALPGRISPIPGETLRGRRIILTLSEEAPWIPGESVSIQITPLPPTERLPFWKRRGLWL